MVWHFICKYPNEIPLVNCPSSFTCFSLLLSPYPLPPFQRHEKVKHHYQKQSTVQIWKHLMLLVLLNMSREVQSNRLTSEGSDGRWAQEVIEGHRLLQLVVESSTGRLHANGKEATAMTCNSKTATFLLVQHDSTGRISWDKWSCKPQKVHMPNCWSCPNVTQKDKENPEKHSYI